MWSRSGIILFQPHKDTAGPMTRTVKMLQFFLDLCGVDDEGYANKNSIREKIILIIQKFLDKMV
ncbi:MAG: hypothetical protein IPG01_02500 [Chitinophagaceae bacterium]|nr:hypothetical protein [Chitinophagaceae bacterium]